MADRTKKTRVTLPGSLADLVRDLQNGGNANAKTAEEQSTTKNAEEIKKLLKGYEGKY